MAALKGDDDDSTGFVWSAFPAAISHGISCASSDAIHFLSFRLV